MLEKRIITLRDIETLSWLSARCRRKLRTSEAAPHHEHRKYRRLLQALNRHLTQLGEEYFSGRPNPKPRQKPKPR
jgi:hypothetical protein